MSTASSIGLGTLSTSGATRLSGSSSGLDTDALVAAIASARRLPAVRLESKITSNDARHAAMGELRTLLGAVKDAAAGLRNPPGALGNNRNLFEAKEAYYSSDTTVSPATLLAIGAQPAAEPGRYEIVVTQLATARKLMTDPVTSAAGTLAATRHGGTAFSGSFTLGTTGGGTAPIAVDGTMSLLDLREAINKVSSTTGVMASVLTIAAGESRLVLSAQETGREVELAPFGGHDVLAITGLSADAGATLKNPLQPARPAKFEIDGLPLERTGNRVTDAVNGLTIDLYHADPHTTVTVEIGRSLAGVKEKIGVLADALNAVRDFIDRQSELDPDGNVAETAALFGDTTLRTIGQTLADTLSGRVAGLDTSAPSSLGALGITIDASNRLVVDGAKLDTALLDDVDGVRSILEFRFSSSSPDLNLFARGNSLADSRFRVDIVDSDADGKAESATIDGVSVDIDGATLVGRKGTAYEGLELIWSGHGSASIDATATRGIAEQLYTAIDEALDDSDGVVSRAETTLTDASERYRKEIERIDQRVQDYRERLVERFAAMEAALALAKSMLQQVQATTDAMFAD